MAQKKKRKAPAARSSKARTAARKSSVKRTTQSRQKEYIDYSLYLEIVLWVVIALDILLFLGMIGIGGVAGRAVSDVFFGLFGLPAYVFPFFIIFFTAFLISNYRSRIAKIKAAGAAGMYLTVCGFMQMLLVGYNKGYSLGEYYQAGAAYHTGGGFFGGCLVSFFCPAIGVAGTYVVFLLMALICCILITQRSLFDGVKKGSSDAFQKARVSRQRHKEEAAKRRREREENRQASADNNGEDPDSLAAEDGFFILPKDKPVRLHRKVSGVTTDTDLFPLRTPAADRKVSAEAEDRKAAESTADRSTADQVPDLPWDKILPETPARKETPLQEDVSSDEDLMNLFKRTAEKDKASASRKSGSQKAAPKASESDIIEVQPEETAGKQQASEEKTARKPKASAAEIQAGIEDVAKEIAMMQAPEKPVYVFPPMNLLKKASGSSGSMTQAELKETAAKLQQVFQTFGVKVKVTNVTCGPSVTRYELTPELGVKVSKIVNLQDDIKLNLAVTDIRIEAPIPGKAAVGIEVPNRKSTGVLLREILESDEFQSHKSRLTYAVGKDIGGNIIVSDIARMPHLLIAGATGSGKSVFINTLIMSILYKADPADVKLIMIDPKVVELSVYNGIPHLFIPVVTDPKKAAGALNWAVAEMQNRYNLFAEAQVRDLKGYNAKIDRLGDIPDKPARLPQIVVIVDELADLMMVSSAEVEEAICRLAQLARAAGIHLVIATQRPSVDVITGLIKANMPSRIAFAVSSGVDSRTILDSVGAEKLLGNGDMLFDPTTFKQPLRVQGAYVSDEEVAKVVDFIKENSAPAQTEEEMKKRMNEVETAAASAAGGIGTSESDTDELFAQAGKLIIDKDKASIGMLQRWFKIGFNRAARIMDQLADAGVVGPEEGTKPRKVLMSEEQFNNYLEQN